MLLSFSKVRLQGFGYIREPAQKSVLTVVLILGSFKGLLSCFLGTGWGILSICARLFFRYAAVRVSAEICALFIILYVLDSMCGILARDHGASNTGKPHDRHSFCRWKFAGAYVGARIAVL